jgi:hypothetical protein
MDNQRNTYGGAFCAPDERQICTIGTGFIANFAASGGGKRAGATLTNKRVYFSGVVFTFIGRRLKLLKRRQIVNTRDITGTGYDFYRPLYLLILGVILLTVSIILEIAMVIDLEVGGFTIIGVTTFIVFLIAYFNKRRTLMFIEYAGGNIAFDVRWIQKHEQDDFIRNIHLAKDKLYSKSAETQGFTDAIHAAAQNTIGGGSFDEIPDL